MKRWTGRLVRGLTVTAAVVPLSAAWHCVAAGVLGVTAAVAVADPDALDAAGPNSGRTVSTNAQLAAGANAALGLLASDVITLDLDTTPGRPFTIVVPFGRSTDTRRDLVIDLAPKSVRSPDRYELLVQGADGVLHPAIPGPVRTLRGAVRGMEGSVVAASILPDGLYARVRITDDFEFWIEPLRGRVPGADARHHVVYLSADVIDTGHTCANEARGVQAGLVPDASPELAACGGGVCVAELACDADVEYFNTYGTVPATEARINAVIDTVNLQYEAQVGITHQITTIIVRTANPDPYTSLDAVTRLCEFITEWTNNQGGVQRDVAHLFTGAQIIGSTIGIAADIGATGICVNNGSCTGGQFGTQGSYSLAQSDFNNTFSCATDLSAHELGHLWGAFHCTCPSNTMNASITCTNSFSAGSISSITAYRDTRACLGSGVPCTQTCQPGNSIENEPACAMNYVDATNGGCNAASPTWSPISLGEGVCGQSGTFSRDIPCTNDTPCTPVGQTCDIPNGICLGGPFTARDTDWWQFTLTQPREVNWCATAEFPVFVGFVDDGGGTACGSSTFLRSATGFQCSQVCVVADLAPGTWTAFVAPNTFTGVPCGATYNADLACDNVAGNPTVHQAVVNLAIPDASPNTPLVHTINVPGSAIIGDIDIDLVITHTWVGDLTVSVEHLGTVVSLIDRPGLPAVDPTFGCSSNDYDIVLDDGGTGGPIEDLCGTDTTTLPPSPPNYVPNQMLSAFDGMDAAGAWTITIADHAAPDPGVLVSWSIHVDALGSNPCAQNLCAGVDCSTLDDVCAVGACNPSDGTCVQDAAALAGAVCRPAAGPCDAQEVCDGVTATCPPDQFITGPCDDGNACTTGDTCAAGVCVGGGPTVCNDSNPCTDDTCNSASGCVFTNNIAPCDDGDGCTTGDTCAAGVCVGGPPLNCSDGIPCTQDTCQGGVCLNQDVVAPVITCPADITVHSDAGVCTAAIDVGTASATDNCSAPAAIVIGAVRGDGSPNLTDPYAAANSPVSVTWTATDAAGNAAQCVQTVTIDPFNELLADVQLAPVVAPAMTRCIDFELFSCAGGPPVQVQQEITFSNGIAGNVPVLVPCGLYDCVRARDPLHTLRRTDTAFAITGTQYRADFTAAGGAADTSLIGGNLNGDPHIDIFDFGTFAGQWNVNFGTGDTLCTTPAPHSDVSGNGMVFTEDFTFIQIHFLQSDDANCCGLASAGGGPVAAISVDELFRRGMGRLAAGDINGDGWLDAQDIVVFLQAHPPPGAAPSLEMPRPEPGPLKTSQPRPNNRGQTTAVKSRGRGSAPIGP